jgi:Cu(I)/Ag(I) efflux system membrane protein CusA/SilA
MYEILITYKTEYKTDDGGDRIRYRINDEREFVRRENGQLIPDSDGRYFRQWRSHIQSPDDIWQEIVEATDHIPGLTSAPKLQPIQVRQIMQQSGMRAPLGIKIKGSSLQQIEDFGFKLENLLKKVPGIDDQTVFANRLIGKPYLEIDVDRNKIARYGLTMADVQQFIKVGLGGIPVTKTVEGRERYTVRVRYAREFRNEPSDIKEMLVPTLTGAQIPLGQLAEITYRKGPQMIKSEDTFLVSYVIFGKQDGISSVEVVENAKTFLQQKIDSGDLNVPAGVSYTFAGSYKNQVRASKHLAVILPITLLLIFLIIYFQFRSVSVTTMIFSSVFVAWAGGFILLWFYGQPWFMNFDLFGQNMRDVFQIGTVNLSIAIWVGFLVLFGVATEGAVVMATYLEQVFEKDKPQTGDEIQNAAMEAAGRRIRPTMMTTATTILALIPVLTSTGRGAEIMVPMAIPSVGGMLLSIITLFMVPVLYAAWKEWRVERQTGGSEILTSN